MDYDSDYSDDGNQVEEILINHNSDEERTFPQDYKTPEFLFNLGFRYKSYCYNERLPIFNRNDSIPMFVNMVMKKGHPVTRRSRKVSF